MKRVVCCAALLSFLAIASAAGGHEGVARKTCGIKRAHTTQITPYVRVVEKDDLGGDRTRVWACSRVGFTDSPHARRHGYKQRRFLGKVICEPTGDTCTYDTVVATKYPRRSRVAFTEGGCSRYAPNDCAGTSVRVVDLKSGEAASTEFSTTSGAPSYFDLTATGTAVWLAAFQEPLYPSNFSKACAG
jgi:hypothetical protein